MNFFQHHLQHTENTTLTDEEKSAMRSVLLRTIANTPVRSPYMTFFAERPLVRVAAAAFVLVLMVGTTTYAAQGALPGDVLYSVKVNLNEKVLGSFVTSDIDKAKWNAGLAEVRLQEAEQLAVSHRLSTTTAAEIESNFDAHTAEASTYTKKAHKNNAKAAEKLSADFSTSLDAHGTVLASLSDLPDDFATTTATSTSSEKGSKKLSDHIRLSAQKFKKDIHDDDNDVEAATSTKSDESIVPDVASTTTVFPSATVTP